MLSFLHLVEFYHILYVCAPLISIRSGVGSEQFGNLIGMSSCCPLGFKHHGNGYCTFKGSYRSGFFYGQGEFKCLAGPWFKGDWRMGKRCGQVRIVQRKCYHVYRDVW